MIVGCRTEENAVSGKYLRKGSKMFHQKFVKIIKNFGELG